MARNPPVPTPNPNDPRNIFPPAPPAGPRVASFTSSRPGSGATLRALMDRRKELAAQQAGIGQQPIQHWMQGVGNLANTFVTGLQERGAAREEQEGRQQLAQVMSGIDPLKGPTPEQSAVLGELDPELQLGFIKMAVENARDRAKQETYGPVVTGDAAKNLGLDPTKSYQLNQQTGQYDQVGGGGTNVTITPPSAEMAGKLGLANGFLDNYDAILKSVDAGEMTGGGYITGVQLGRGNGGTMYRNLLQGTEAMIRILTGAGMSESEARSRVTQYEPAALDDATTLRSKVQGLKQALDNVIGGVASRGQPTDPAAPADPNQPAPTEPTTPAPDGIPEIDPGDFPSYDALPEGAQYKIKGGSGAVLSKKKKVPNGP